MMNCPRAPCGAKLNPQNLEDVSGNNWTSGEIMLMFPTAGREPVNASQRYLVLFAALVASEFVTTSAESRAARSKMPGKAAPPLGILARMRRIARLRRRKSLGISMIAIRIKCT
jgi:hypothetical protein